MKLPHSKLETKNSETRPTIPGLIVTHEERGHDALLESSIISIKNRANRGEK